MIPRIKSSIVKFVYVLIDVLFICLAINLACYLRSSTLTFDLNPRTIFLDTANPYRFVFVFWAIITILSINARSLYQTRREIVEGFEIWALTKAVVTASLVVIVVIYTMKFEGFPRSIIFVGIFFMIVLLSIWRLAKRRFVEYLVSNGYNNYNALIIGGGKVGSALYYEIKKRPAMGIKVLGFLDDNKDKPLTDQEPPILGKISDFIKIARREFVNKIFVTINIDNVEFVKLLERAKDLGIAVRVVPHGFEFMSREFFKYNIGFIPILEYSNQRLLRIQIGKRLFDFFTSLLGLILLSVPLLVISLIIKFTSPGPVFYFSRRYGRRGRMFSMFKFRSMISNADEVLDEYKDRNDADGPMFKMRKDPRVTNIGRFLRKYSLDELPQLFNVLKGDMSLVGPRPLPIEQIEKEDIQQLKRLEVRPGITGLWQIRGRSDISFKRLVRWDVWYINNWSFWLDLNILWQTFPVVIKGKGAY